MFSAKSHPGIVAEQGIGCERPFFRCANLIISRWSDHEEAEPAEQFTMILGDVLGPALFRIFRSVIICVGR